jgi:hypothetical protein
MYIEAVHIGPAVRSIDEHQTGVPLPGLINGTCGLSQHPVPFRQHAPVQDRSTTVLAEYK